MYSFREFLTFKFSHFTHQVKLFLLGEGNLKFSESKMRWIDETENYFFRKSLNFRENDTEALEISKRPKLT